MLFMHAFQQFVKLLVLVLVGEKFFQMGFYMLLGNPIIPFSKPQECIEWTVRRFTLWFLARSIVLILKSSCSLTKINQLYSMSILVISLSHSLPISACLLLIRGIYSSYWRELSELLLQEPR